MKKNRKWLRVTALVLAMACLVSAVFAATFDASLDLSGDNKINVWDIQMAVNDGETAQAQKILTGALGSPDELNPVSDNTYEIYTTLGLYNMAKLAAESDRAAGKTFVLKADIDLGGANWTPIDSFKGTLNGNNKTIKNFAVTKSTNVSNSTADKDRYNMGFFGTVDTGAVVQNLKLEQVTVTATDNAGFIGLLTGSNRGQIIDCTTEGIVTDSRTTLNNTVYVGAIAGRNNDGSGTIAVTASAQLLTASSGAEGTANPEDKVEGLTSKMAMDFAVLSYPEGTEDDEQYGRELGIAGHSLTAQVTGDPIWQDTTGSIAYKSQTEQERRQTAVDEMYKMGTVKWTTSKLLTYTINKGTNPATHIHSNIYIPGTTYYGIPYNGVGGGYDRAMSIMQTDDETGELYVDAEGRYVMRDDQENGTDDNAGTKTGFILMMGNDCSSAIGWAWGAVAPARIPNVGTKVTSTPYMIPNDYNTKNYGVLPAGGYQTITSEYFGEDEFPKDACDTQSIIALNGGAEGMAEYYAKSTRGDALLCVEYALDTTNDTWVKDTGHARLLAGDPVIIRDADGAIDLNTSYVITHEQGDGLFDNRNASGNYETYNGYNVKQTSWRINYKYTLDVLLTEDAYNAATRPGCGWGYVPVTIPAFSYEGELKEPYTHRGYEVDQQEDPANQHPIQLPNSGWYYSNWLVNSVTMVITDENGTELYNKTGYPSGRVTACQKIKLEELFGDSLNVLAEKNAAAGTYYCKLTWVAADGVERTIENNTAFTYTPETTTTE